MSYKSHNGTLMFGTLMIFNIDYDLTVMAVGSVNDYSLILKDIPWIKILPFN